MLSRAMSLAALPQAFWSRGVRLIRGPAAAGRSRRMAVLADQAVVSLTNLLTTVALARAASVGEVGLYAACFSFIFIASAIQTAVILLPYTVLSPRQAAEDLDRYRSSVLVHQMMLGAVVGLIGAAAGVVMAIAGSLDLARALFVLAPAAGLVVFREFARRVCFAELRYFDALLVDGTTAAVQLSLVFAMAGAGTLSATTTLLAVGLASLAGGAVWLRRRWFRIDIDLSAARAHLGLNWVQGRWLLRSSILWSLSVEQFPWLLAVLADPRQAGVWAACAGVVGFSNPLIQSINNEIGPKIAHATASQGAGAVSGAVLRAMASTGLLLAPLVVVVAFFGQQLLSSIYGAEYGTAASVATVLAFSNFLFACGLSMPYGLLALDAPQKDFVANVAAVAVLPLAGIWFVIHWGALGAALSAACSNAVSIVVRAVLLRNALHRAQGANAE